MRALFVFNVLAAALLIWAVISTWRAVKAAPVPKIICSAKQYTEQVLNAATKKIEDRETWTAECRIEQDGKEIYENHRLTLPYPAKFRDAMEAIDDFRTTKAPEILKEMGK